MKKTLHEYIQRVLLESDNSDAYERLVADNINNLSDNIHATRPKVSAAYSDVLVEIDDIGSSWLEVKMNHSDNLSNPRVFYDGLKWDTTYKTPAAAYAIASLNSSEKAAEFVRQVSEFSNIEHVILPTSISGLKNPLAVPLETMRSFVDGRENRYIITVPDVDIGDLVTKHYTLGKKEPAYYIQAADDFYLIGDTDPLGLNAFNVEEIPVLAGIGDFKIRVATRSDFYEIQAEIKIKKMMPTSSPYSVLSGSSKINPFLAFVEPHKGVV